MSVCKVKVTSIFGCSRIWQHVFVSVEESRSAKLKKEYSAQTWTKDELHRIQSTVQNAVRESHDWQARVD